MTTFSRRVAASADDGYYDDGPEYFNNTNDLYLASWGYNFTCFFRFANVVIDNAATINTAIVTLTSIGSLSGTVLDLTIKGIKETNATAPTSRADGLGRTLTTASVAWNGVGAWFGEGTYDSPDVSAIISEIVGQGGWASGNALCLVISCATNTSAYRDAYPYDLSTAKAALLSGTFTAGAAPSGLFLMLEDGSGAYELEDASGGVLLEA
jgi:hypothetical protein